MKKYLADNWPWLLVFLVWATMAGIRKVLGT